MPSPLSLYSGPNAAVQHQQQQGYYQSFPLPGANVGAEQYGAQVPSSTGGEYPAVTAPGLPIAGR